MEDCGGILPLPDQPNVIPISEIPKNDIRVQYYDGKYFFILLFSKDDPTIFVKGYAVLGDAHAVTMAGIPMKMYDEVTPLVDRETLGSVYIKASPSKQASTLSLYYTADGCKCMLPGHSETLRLAGVGSSSVVSTDAGVIGILTSMEMAPSWKEKLQGIDAGDPNMESIYIMAGIITSAFGPEFPAII